MKREAVDLQKRAWLIAMLSMLLCVMITGCRSNGPYEVILKEKPLETFAATQTSKPEMVVESESPETMETAQPSETEENTEAQPSAASEKTPNPEETPAPTPVMTEEPKKVTGKRFYVERESKDMQKLFQLIYDGISAHETEIMFPDGTKLDDVKHVMWLLSVDCPELFWYAQKYEYTYPDNNPDTVLNLCPKYTMNQEEAKKAQKQIDALVEKWTEATEGKAEYETELYVHDAILSGCTYSTSTDFGGTIYGALIKGKALCKGYANAMCYVLRSMGMECAVITGTATDNSGTESHAWNIMKIDGVWTLSDPTWDDPVGSNMITYAYLNVTDDMLNRSHVRNDEFKQYDIPSCTSLKQNFCRRNNRYVEEGESVEEALVAWTTAYLLEKDEPHVICFAEKAQYDEALNIMDQCFQTAVNQTKVNLGSVSYSKVAGMHYLQFI